MTTTKLDLVDCKFCGKPTPMTETKMCDNCWEIQRRCAQVTNVVLFKILLSVKKDFLNYVRGGQA